MKKLMYRALAFAGAWFVVSASIIRAVDFTDRFTANPLTNGWHIFGDTNLFQWDRTNHDIDVTWDSSQSNSYFYRPLGTTLTTNSSFSYSFDINVSNCVITAGTFQIAAGLMNYQDAVSPDYLRGTGYNSTNLVEFDFFTDPEYGNSVAATEYDANGSIADVYDDYEWTANVSYHVEVTYFAGDPLISAQLWTGGQQVSYLPAPYVETNFSGFGVDTLAIMSYNDAGTPDDNYNFGDVSLFAQGTVGNFSFTTSPNPAPYFTGGFINGIWQGEFQSYATWNYALQRSTNLQSWSTLSALTNGSGTIMTLQDTNPPPTRAFYRIQAQHYIPPTNAPTL